jgi:PBSX family phage terminase large subunit
VSGIVVNISKEKFLPCYLHLLDSEEFFDIDFLYGGRDSGKSRHLAQQLIVDCLRDGYFKCLLIREVLNTVRDSQFSLIKSIIEAWNMTSLFSFNDTRLEIKCINGNGFFGRGLDDVARIKSFNNPSHAWIEEGNQVTANDFVVVLTSLRAEQRVKTWFSFNPECECNYTEFWLWQEWFSHTEQLSWITTKTIEVDDEQIEFRVRATHTTYKDNPYCKPQRKALYESYKNSKNNAYWYQTYTLGLWGYRRTGGEFWKCFEEVKHTGDATIDPKSIIYVIADNNVNPYIAVSLWQADPQNKIIYQVGELPCEHPDNTASKAAKRVVKYLDSIGYILAVHVGGDPSANKKSTEDDEGRSFFDKFKAAIRDGGYRVIDRVERSAPEVARSGEFINEIYESNYQGWKIVIGKQCRKSIEDYNMTKEDKDGKILKKAETDVNTKVSFQRYGHFSDCKRYYITMLLKVEFNQYKARSKKYFGVAT